MVRARLERAVAAIYNKQDVPVYWLELAAFTGPAEALFFDPFDSFEAVEEGGRDLGAAVRSASRVASDAGWD